MRPGAAAPLRVFTAIPLESHILAKLRALSAELAEKIPGGVRWVRGENYHLTLKFYGDVPATGIPALWQHLSEASQPLPAFSLTAAGLGVFPSLRAPAVIWAGLSAHPQLTRLVEQVEAASEAAGFPRETRPFSPHLTLGRVERDCPPNIKAQISQLIEDHQKTEIGTVVVNRLVVFSSERTAQGMRYSPLHTQVFA